MYIYIYIYIHIYIYIYICTELPDEGAFGRVPDRHPDAPLPFLLQPAMKRKTTESTFLKCQMRGPSTQTLDNLKSWFSGFLGP